MLKQVSLHFRSGEIQMHMYHSNTMIILGGRPPIENLYVDSPPRLIDLVITCWNHDAGKRPSMELIVEELKRFPTDSNRLSL